MGCGLGADIGLPWPPLYLGVFGFNVAVAFMIGEYTLGVVDLFLLGPLVILAWTQIERPSNQATLDDLTATIKIFLHHRCDDGFKNPLAKYINGRFDQ